MKHLLILLMLGFAGCSEDNNINKERAYRDSSTREVSIKADYCIKMGGLVSKRAELAIECTKLVFTDRGLYEMKSKQADSINAIYHYLRSEYELHAKSQYYYDSMCNYYKSIQ